MNQLPLVFAALLPCAAFGFELAPGSSLIPPGEVSASKWIWHSASEPTNRCVSYYRTTFRADGKPKSGSIDVFFDDCGTLWVNGTKKEIGDITDALRDGVNTLAFELHNDRGVSAINFLLSGVGADGKVFYVHSDAHVKSARTVPQGWEQPAFDDSAWDGVKTLGDVLQAPWSKYFDIRGRMTTPAERARLRAAEAMARELPACLATEPPIAAKVVYQGGAPKIEINGRAFEPVWNLGANVANVYCASQTIRLGKLGVRFHQINFGASHYDPVEGAQPPAGCDYDFSRYDENARQLLHLQPDAYLVLGIRFNMNRWAAQHPDDQVGYATGPASAEDRDDYLGRPIRPSCASVPFREHCLDVIRQFGAYVTAQPWGNRVAAIRVEYGVYREWHTFGMYEAPDAGKAMTARFRSYLKAKYGVRPEFETAEVPSVAARTNGGMLLDPVKDRRTLDYYDCHANAMADLLLAFAHEAKRALPGRLVGAYYGYVLANHTPEGSNVLLEKVLASPDIDFLNNPPFYSGYSRQAGGGYDPRTVPSVFRRYGKISILEDDSRYHHLYDLMAKGDKTWSTRSPRETRACVRRNWLNGFFNGCGAQLNDAVWTTPDQGARPGAFDDPAVLEAIEESEVARQKAGTCPIDSGNEIAVVVSPRERIRRDGAPKVTRENAAIYSDAIHHLRRSGFSFDLMTLEDYLAGGPNYATVLFLNTFYLTDAERAAVKARLANDAATPIWFVAPGSVTDAGFSDAAMSDLAGMNLAGSGTLPNVRPMEPVEKICDGAAYLKTTATGRILFVPSAPATPAAYAALFVAAGARSLTEPGPYVRRRGDVLMLHVGDAGRYAIRPLARDAGRTATELFSGVSAPADRLAVEADGPATWLFKIN